MLCLDFVLTLVMLTQRDQLAGIGNSTSIEKSVIPSNSSTAPPYISLANPSVPLANGGIIAEGND